MHDRLHDRRRIKLAVRDRLRERVGSRVSGGSMPTAHRPGRPLEGQHRQRRGRALDGRDLGSPELGHLAHVHRDGHRRRERARARPRRGPPLLPGGARRARLDIEAALKRNDVLDADAPCLGFKPWAFEFVDDAVPSCPAAGASSGTSSSATPSRSVRKTARLSGAEPSCPPFSAAPHRRRPKRSFPARLLPAGRPRRQRQALPAAHPRQRRGGPQRQDRAPRPHHQRAAREADPQAHHDYAQRGAEDHLHELHPARAGAGPHGARRRELDAGCRPPGKIVVPADAKDYDILECVDDKGSASTA